MVAAIAGLFVIGIFVLKRPMEMVLPNGFVIRGNSTVLSADRRTVLHDDVEFMCFDNRFLLVTGLSKGGALFDNRTGAEVKEHRDYPPDRKSTRLNSSHV